MTASLLTTRLYTPRLRPELVPRPSLVERLSVAMDRKLTLVSAPAGFGKTTLLSEWVADSDPHTPVVWLSLDEGDNDPARFWAYFVAALRTIHTRFGEGVLGALQSPQPPPIEAVLASLINEMATVPHRLAFVLDDYHLIESRPTHDALSFLLDRMPPSPRGMHLVIATRKDPLLPLPGSASPPDSLIIYSGPKSLCSNHSTWPITTDHAPHETENGWHLHLPRQHLSGPGIEMGEEAGDDSVRRYGNQDVGRAG